MPSTMAGIMGVFQIVWVYYGLLIASRPVIAWNMVAVVINFLSVGAYVRFARREREASEIFVRRWGTASLRALRQSLAGPGPMLIEAVLD